MKNLKDSSSGYHKVDPGPAQALANQGILVFGLQHGDPHGHIVTVRPEGVPGDKPLVPRNYIGPDMTVPLLANVGLFNGVSHAHVAMVPKHGDILYYAPKR